MGGAYLAAAVGAASGRKSAFAQNALAWAISAWVRQMRIHPETT
jgi:hypothetical protein